MIRHIVLLELQPSATAADRAAILEALATLPDRIPTVRNYVAAADAGLAEGNADICAIGDFDDVAGYEAYRDHEAHRQVIADHIAPVLAGRTAIQVEI
jgi:hypothetical protein